MNFKKYSILIVLIIYLLGCTHNVEKQNEVVEVNYLSFQIETYSPVTTESISNTTYKKIFLNKKEIIEIYALLKQVKSPLTFQLFTPVSKSPFLFIPNLNLGMIIPSQKPH